MSRVPLQKPVRSRLFDRLLATQPREALPPEAWARTIPVVVTDEITRWFSEDTPKDEWDLRTDFPNVAPPWPLAFMEARIPKTLLTRNGRETFSSSMQGGSWGCFLAGDELTDGGWILSAGLWVHCLEFTPAFLGGAVLRTNHDGTPCEIKPGVWSRVVPNSRSDVMRSYPEDLQISVVRQVLNPFLLAICFIHCKNVTLREVAPKESHSRRYQKEHGRKLVRYHVLDIEPMKQVLRTEGQSETVGLKRAVHICRGHFKDYRQRGLFGKTKGLFWWDMHVRGHASQGIVLKDYEVKEPVAPPKWGEQS